MRREREYKLRYISGGDINNSGSEELKHVSTCCRCYWNDQCCMGCNVEQVECDDFTPLYEEDIDYILEKEYWDDLDVRVDEYDDLIREMEGLVDLK